MTDVDNYKMVEELNDLCTENNFCLVTNIGTKIILCSKNKNGFADETLYFANTVEEVVSWIKGYTAGQKLIKL